MIHQDTILVNVDKDFWEMDTIAKVIINNANILKLKTIINIFNIYLNYNSLFLKHQLKISIKQILNYLHRIIYVSKK